MVGKKCAVVPFQDSNVRHSFLLKRCPKAYSPCTLIDNWFNERLYIKEEKYNRTIVPTITTKAECECGTSSYKEEFADPKSIKRTDVPTFEENYLRYKANKLRGKDSTAMTTDSKYMRNYTTTTDIMYRLRPKQDNWSHITDRPVKIPKKNNMLQNYGNETNFGLRGWLKNVRNQENLYRTDDTTYTVSYQNPKMTMTRNLRNR